PDAAGRAQSGTDLFALQTPPSALPFHRAVGSDGALDAHARCYAKVSTTRQSFAPQLTILITVRQPPSGPYIVPARCARIPARCERALVDVPFIRPRSRPWPSCS